MTEGKVKRKAQVPKLELFVFLVLHMHTEDPTYILKDKILLSP